MKSEPKKNFNKKSFFTKVLEKPIQRTLHACYLYYKQKELLENNINYYTEEEYINVVSKYLNYTEKE